jgi:flagellar P-ring protein precursor FlgI
MLPRKDSTVKNISKYLRAVLVATLMMGCVMASVTMAQEVRIKDLANVRGVRSNQLMGVGLVVGLSKTGDSAASLSTNKATAAMLQRMGLKVTEQQLKQHWPNFENDLSSDLCLSILSDKVL